MGVNEKHILLVEDNPVAVKVAHVLFEMEGCRVDDAKDGNEAVEMARKNHYDGIYMDIGLPIIDGIEACRRIREYEEKNHLQPVPIIAVTANDSEEERKQYFSVGMQAVLGKPFTRDKIIKFLSLCLQEEIK